MDQVQAHGSNQPNAKRRKINEENDDGGSSASAADAAIVLVPAANVEQTGDIFTLDIDCFEEAFDYLRHKDLISVSKTCKRLQQVAGYCFQQNYLGRALCDSYDIESEYLNIQNMVPFIQRIVIDKEGFQNFYALRSKFHQLKQIHIEHMEITDINRLKECNMSKLEVLRVTDCDLGIKFHETIDNFPKLKRLEIYNCTSENNWFLRKYPTLEHLEIVFIDFSRGIPMFLELNPNIRKFATLSETLWTLQDKIKTSNISLDDLAIQIIYENDDEFKLLCDLFNELHDRGFYRKLQLYFDCHICQKQINLLTDVKGLSKVLVSSNDGKYSFSALKSLEEICLHTSKIAVDLEMLTNNLINLKCIQFGWASINDIMPFIRRSVKIQKIKVAYFNEKLGIVDLLALNREREQLPDAQKITLYVNEIVYLATKWALGETDLRLIRLKRNTSFKWRNDFRGFIYDY